MRIPDSLKPKLILHHAGETIKRFPLVLLACAVSGGIIEYNERFVHWDNPISLRLLFTALLLIPTFLSIRLLRERGEKLKPWILLLLPAVFFTFADKPELYSVKYQFAQLLLATHVFAAIAPFLRGRRDGEFWEFNKTLFLRFILSTIYSGVLLLGLYLCMGALKGLFLVDITGHDFSTVFFACAFLFHPMHFLAGVPRELDRVPEYPRALQIFCQNLFIPLVGILGTILVVYTVTIIANSSWPKGLVSLLISTFASLGLLSILLVDPLIRNRVSWLPKYERYFFVTMTILSVVMLAAGLRRISDYAITEQRYFVILIGLWLFVMGSLFVAKPGRPIKLIPVSLFFIALFSAYGPWSAHSVAFRSQRDRLVRILSSNGILVDGKLRPEGKKLKSGEKNNIVSIVDYIDRYHGMKALRPSITFNGNSNNRFYEEAGIDHWDWNYEIYWSIYASVQNGPVNISGFDRMENFSLTASNETNGKLRLTPTEFIIEIGGEKRTVTMEEFLGNTDLKSSVSTKRDVILESPAGKKKWKVIVNNASGYSGGEKSSRRIQSVSGILLY